MKVLIVDDNTEDRKLLAFYMKEKDCEIVEAGDGKAGLEMALLHRPELIISDALMPVADGFQFLYEIRRQPELAATPFVFYSAVYTGSMDEEFAHSLGADAFITKPLEPEAFYQALDAVLAECRLKTRRPEKVRSYEAPEFLRQYGVVVATKLEEKCRELTRANEELESRVRERTAALEAINQELKTYSYSVSHDLKAPLRGIDGYSRLLEEGYRDRLDDEGRRFVAQIRHGVAQMNLLIDDLLLYSRMERRELHNAPLDLPATVHALVAEVHRDQAVFSIEIPPLSVYADRDGLAVVLRNLLENAVKFSRAATPPTIELGARSEGDKVILWVRDNGIGFDMQFHDRIFEIFQRLQRSEDYPGTGIGLALVQKAMQRMGGRVWAESSPGCGATFYLELPG